MTIGEDMLKKPINKIIKYCPKPNVSLGGTLAYLKKACKGRNYAQEDMRLIIDGIIGHATARDWINVTSISVITLYN